MAFITNQGFSMSEHQGRHTPSPSTRLSSGAPARPGAAAALRAAVLICVPLAVWCHDSGTAVQAQPAAGVPAAAVSVHTLDLPAAPLADALSRLASETGGYLSVDGALTAGKQAPALRGHMTLRQALDTLLRGSGLEARESGGRYFIQPAPPQRDGVASLDTVTVRGALDPKDEAYQAPLSVSVLTRDDIERFRGTSVGDIFKGTPGVLVGELRNSGGLDINIRGMQGQGRVPVLIDGARQETTVNRGYSGVVSRSYIDPDLIGGITIDKGPTMSADGTGATGGLVSMRTIGADDIVKSGESFGMRLRGQAIGNNSGSPVAPDTPAGLDAGGRFGADPVYRVDCATPSICQGQHALPTEWGYPDGLNRPATLQPKSWAGSLAIAKRWEHIDLVVAHAQRRQGNYYAGKHGPSAQIDLSDQRRRPFFTEIRPVIQGASFFQAGERIPGTNYNSKSTLLKASTYLPHDQELELSFLRYHSEYSEVIPTQIIRTNLGPMVQPRNSEVTVNTYTSRYRWHPEDLPLLDLRAKLWHTRTRATNNSPSATAVLQYNNDRETYKRTGLSLENTASLDLGAWGQSQARRAERPMGRRRHPAVDLRQPPGRPRGRPR